MLSALVHTQGVVLGSSYVPLEMAYVDVLGVQAHFLITSPISFTAMRKFYPHSRSDVTLITDGGTPYSHVLEFLRTRYQCLLLLLLQAESSAVVFGYKGGSYQPQILRDAGIPSIFNIEEWGDDSVPALPPPPRATCPFHPPTRFRSKCAAAAIEAMLRHVQVAAPECAPAP